MNYLSLDVGGKHTGVAYADSQVNIALPLDTIHHDTEEELIEAVRDLVDRRRINTIVVGLPLFLSGEESEQTYYVRNVSEKIGEACPACSVECVDERETSRVFHGRKSKDPHAQAAATILRVFLERKK